MPRIDGFLIGVLMLWTIIYANVSGTMTKDISQDTASIYLRNSTNLSRHQHEAVTHTPTASTIANTGAKEPDHHSELPADEKTKHHAEHGRRRHGEY
ncbi:hypothetical protein K7432_003496, partial [Basidiobolus ranarum]